MSPLLRTTDFAAYRELLRATAGCPVGLIVADGGGQVLWSSAQSCPEEAAELSARVIANGRDMLVEGKVLYAVRDDRELASVAVFAGDDLLCIVTAVCRQRHADGKSGDLVLTQPLSILRRFLTREICLNREIETVSEELGERYEELNLLYSTEESLQHFDDPTAATRQLVEKSIAHLKVDAVVLSVPDKNISVRQQEADSTLSAPDLERITSSVTALVRLRAAALLSDDEQDPGCRELFQELGINCLAIPLFDARGGTDGALIAVKSFERGQFYNSDRNLLEIMTERIRWVMESTRDSLTGLLARHAFEQRLKASLVMSRTTRVPSVVLYANIDRLHVINDICGPHAGDAAICEVSRAVEEVLEDTGVVARLGGDEFGVLVTDCSIEKANELANSICERVKDIDFAWNDTEHDLSISIGVGAITSASANSDEILGAAEIACAEAKADGGGRFRTLRQHDTVLVMRQNEMKWIGRVREALRDSRFELNAHSIVPIHADSDCVHHEILLRMRDKNGEVVMPDEFLPAAERYNLMPDIDRWVVDNVLARLADHWSRLDAQTRARELKTVSWAINLSGQSICDLRLLNFIIQRLDHYQLPPELLCFEVTESAAARNIGDARRLIAALRARGCKVSLDDFGTGVSSFAYLKNLPVDYLKIDGSFVRPILEDVVSRSVVAAISQIAKALKLKTVAEFVETEEIASHLQELGIDFGQGYAYSKPIPLEQVLESRALTAEAAS